MLKDILKENLLENADSIYNIIEEFFSTIKIDKLDNKAIINLLNNRIERIMVFERRYEFKKKLSFNIK